MAVYPKGSDKAFAQVDKLRRDDRVQMIADTAKALLPYFGSCGANDRMHQQLSSLSRLQSNKNRGTCLRDLDECRAVAVELSDLAGKAYEAFELQKRADKLTGKIVK